MDDERIIELYFARDEQAIRETASKYGRFCFRISYNMLNSHEDAEECVNDTYAGLWNAIPPARPDSLMAFAAGVVRNLSLKRLAYVKREKRSREVTLSLEELGELLPDERYMPGVEDEGVGRLISTFLHQQKEEVRQVFVRRYYFFDSISEIARRYSFSQSKVKNMLFQTRNRLRDYLVQQGVAASGFRDNPKQSSGGAEI